MKRFYEDKGEYWIIKKGLTGFVMLRLTRFPDYFFRTWFIAVPGFVSWSMVSGAMFGFTSHWAGVHLVLLPIFLVLMFFVSLFETAVLFVRLHEEGHLKIVKKEKP